VINPTPEDEAALEATKAPLMEHLVELRSRLIWSVTAFAIAFGVAFYFAQDVYGFITLPLAAALRAGGSSDPHLIFTALGEPFFAQVKLGMFGGLCLAFPLIAGQLWMFVAPGLYRHERNALLPFLLLAPVLFVAGAAFAYYVLLPFAIHFFLGYQSPGAIQGALAIQFQGKVSEYIDLVIKIILAFGITFQMPILLGLLGKVGIVTAKQLRDMRRFAIVGMFAIAAVVTPPDPISMLALAFPLVALYEGSILWVAYYDRRRARLEAERAKQEAGSSTEVAASRP
jgi:sec-independent protein translocase protein TatC